MDMSLQEIADVLKGTVEGDGAVRIRGVAPIGEAKVGDLTFVANPKYRAQMATTAASAVIVPPGLASEGRNLLVHPNSYLAFARAVALFNPAPPPPEPGVKPGASVDPTARVAHTATVLPGAFVGPGAQIGNGTCLHPGVYVGRDVTIGQDCEIFANAVIYHDTVIGDRVILHAGVVLGSDGYGYARDGATSVKIRQVGNVVVEDDVEIGANCTVDRAVLGETRIGSGTKIDNLVQIGHNVTIGHNSLIVAQVGISGSSVVGDNVTLAGQVGVAGHIRIGNGVEVGAKSGVVDDVPDGEKVLGLPAIPLSQARKVLIHTRFLPEMRKALRDLRHEVAALAERLEKGDGK